LKPKLTYLARRNPTLGLDEFRQNWRAHGALAMGLPMWDNIERYTQADAQPVPDRLRGRLPGFDDSQDGIATLLYKSVDHLRADFGEPVPVLLRDEARVFDRLVTETSLYTDERVERDLGGTAAKLVLFAVRGSADEAEFAAAWDSQTEAVLACGEGVRSYRRSARITVPGVTDEPTTVSHLDAMTEIGFASLDDLFAALADDRFVAALAELDPVADRSRQRSMVTNELLLYGD